jgi:hypothetical protein
MLRTCGRIRNQELDRHQNEKSDPFWHQNNAYPQHRAQSGLAPGFRKPDRNIRINK